MAETSTGVAKKKDNANVISLFMAGAKKRILFMCRNCDSCSDSGICFSTIFNNNWLNDDDR